MGGKVSGKNIVYPRISSNHSRVGTWSITKSLEVDKNSKLIIVVVLRIRDLLSSHRYLVSFILKKASRSTQFDISRSTISILNQRVLSACILCCQQITRIYSVNQACLRKLLSPQVFCSQNIRLDQILIPATPSLSVSSRILNWC
jgi:hypothetical protein